MKVVLETFFLFFFSQVDRFGSINIQRNKSVKNTGATVAKVYMSIGKFKSDD